LGWSAKRELAKINYHIHTDAVKQNLVPKELTAKQAAVSPAEVYALLAGGKVEMRFEDKKK